MVKMPSALKWTLSRRARLKGERDRLVSRPPELGSTIGKETAQAERRLNSCRRRLAMADVHGPGRLKALDADLAAIGDRLRCRQGDWRQVLKVVEFHRRGSVPLVLCDLDHLVRLTLLDGLPRGDAVQAAVWRLQERQQRPAFRGAERRR